MIDKEKFEQFLQLGNGSTDFFVELLDKFIQSAEKILDDCKKSLQNKDEEDVKMQIHTLKGSSLNLGFTKLANFLIALEDKLNSVEFSVSESDMDELDKMMSEIKSFRKKY